MNKEYMKLNENNYIVTNDDGEIVIKKSNGNIEEILMKENEIEEIYNDILNNTKLLDITENNENIRKKSNKIFIILGIYFTIMGYLAKLNIIVTLTNILGILFFKKLFLFITKTKKSNKRKMTELKISIDSNSQKVETLTKELEELKNKNNYKIIPSLETHINSMEQPTREQYDCKIKRLVLDNKQ